jgi:hypothetical protein
MENIDFNKFLKEAFEKLELEVTMVAKTFQVAPSTIQRWLNGQVKPLPRFQREIIRWLERRLKRQERIKKNAEAIRKE